MKASFRILYRQVIPILSCCLLATTLTGIILGLSYRLIQLPDRVIAILIDLHQGMFLGDKISPIYVLLMGLGVFVLGLKIIVEGKYNLLFQSAPPTVANVLRIIGLILVIPLAVCVETGVAYRLGTDWFGIPNEDTAGFLFVHGGYYLGTILGIFYLFIVGIGLITLLILNRKRSKASTKKIRQTLQQQLKTTYASQNFPSKKVVLGKNKLAVIYALIAFLGILYYMTSALFVAIAATVIVAVLSAVLLSKNLTSTKFSQGRQEKKQALTISHKQEADSITMIKAIPDAMLRISQDGICLSYMPAKEATSFILYGNIVNKHISEFLAPEIAEQFIVSAQSSLQTGSTNICRFPILIDSEKQHYEARVTPIGDTEVLILVREIAADFGYSSVVTEHIFARDSTTIIQPLIESEFLQVLETTLSNNKQRNHILLCLAMDARTSNEDVLAIDDNLIFEIATQVNSLLPSSIISRLDDNNLTILVSDRTIETASILVDDLHLNLKQLLDAWQQKTSSSIEFNIALIEVNRDNSDAVSLIAAAKATCQMAKQKVNFKTFW